MQNGDNQRKLGALTLDEANDLCGPATHCAQALQQSRAILGSLGESGAGSLGSLGGSLRSLVLCGVGGLGGRRGVAEGGASHGKARVPQHGAGGSERHFGWDGERRWGVGGGEMVLLGRREREVGDLSFSFLGAAALAE